MAHSPEKIRHLTFQADLAELERLTTALDDWGQACGYAPKLSGMFNVCLDEIVTNIIKHGYEKSNTRGVIELFLNGLPEMAEVIVKDDAPAFDPLSANAPDFDLELEDMPIGGLGIYLTKEMMDEVIYEYQDGRNTLILRKKPE